MTNLLFNSRADAAIPAFYNYLDRRLDVFSNLYKYTLLSVVDIGLFTGSIVAAIGFEVGIGMLSTQLWQHSIFILLAIAIKFGTFWGFNIYRQVLRHADSAFSLKIVKAVVVSYLIIIAIDRCLSITTLSASVLVNDAMLTVILTIAMRVNMRWMLMKMRQRKYASQATSKFVIYGAGSAGCLLAQTLTRQSGKQLIGFVDDNSALHGRIVCGTKVYAPAELLKLKASIGFEEILLAMPSIEPQRKRALLQRLQILSVPIKTVPSLNELLGDTAAIGNVRKLDIEDLLGRKAIAARPELLQHDITDRVVLVTGGGGSIGSELCRQIAKQRPKLLIVFELHEFALYQMDMELTENYPDLAKVAYLGSVTDAQAVTQVLDRYKVDTIYHAAAYKHVPIVEANPISGTINNISGTLTAAQCAIACGVPKFVLISTDKAVRPTNIMGATKRVAELVLQALADLNNHQTCFTMVRFGNVLGSSGSVVPRFREQITSGKSITLTHREITRYFMTIPEAATLVIQAGAMSKGGEVFLLNMGEPIKIYDLAVQMIRLHGLEPDRDVKIEVTGLRPGEKIYEELLIDCDAALPTEHPKIFCAREAKLAWQKLSPQLTKLLSAAAVSEVDNCVSILQELVPEYQPMGQYAKINTAASEALAASISDRLKKAELYQLSRQQLQKNSVN